MRVTPHDRRLPAALAVVLMAVLLVTGVALAVHELGAGDHTMALLGACLAVFALIVAVGPEGTASPLGAAIPKAGPSFPRLPDLRRGRYPPEDGTILIC